LGGYGLIVSKSLACDGFVRDEVSALNHGMWAAARE
jgi:hypothetical protein